MKEEKRKIKLLDSVFEANRSRESAAIQKIEFAFPKNSISFHPGPFAYYTLDFRNNCFLHIDENIVNITGIEAADYMNRKPAESICEAADPAHIEAIADFLKQALDFLKNNTRRKRAIANIEHNIITPQGQHKRIILQFYPVEESQSGEPICSRGCIIDITHIRKDGLPGLFILCENQLIYQETADPQALIRDGDISLSKTELKILGLVHNGLLAKEIAARLEISISTLYTHRKNIKLKTGKDLIVVISELREKGLIQN